MNFSCGGFCHAKRIITLPEHRQFKRLRSGPGQMMWKDCHFPEGVQQRIPISWMKTNLKQRVATRTRIFG